MKSRPARHVFGPVPSRRLGRSLGIDLVPFKTCSYDCIYCQLGRTTRKTVERREWVPVGAVLDELRRALDSRPDYITLIGSGEPTLHSGLGEIIAGIRAMCDIPVAVLADFCDIITNGSDAPGTILDDCSQEFLKQFAAADFVVAKGQGNYESLAGARKRIFFLFKIKCAVVGHALGCPCGSLVVRQQM